MPRRAAPRALFALHALYSRSTRSIRAPRALFAPEPSQSLLARSSDFAPNSLSRPYHTHSLH